MSDDFDMRPRVVLPEGTPAGTKMLLMVFRDSNDEEYKETVLDIYADKPQMAIGMVSGALYWLPELGARFGVGVWNDPGMWYVPILEDIRDFLVLRFFPDGIAKGTHIYKTKAGKMMSAENVAKSLANMEPEVAANNAVKYVIETLDGFVRKPRSCTGESLESFVKSMHSLADLLRMVLKLLNSQK